MSEKSEKHFWMRSKLSGVEKVVAKSLLFLNSDCEIICPIPDPEELEAMRAIIYFAKVIAKQEEPWNLDDLKEAVVNYDKIRERQNGDG